MSNICINYTVFCIHKYRYSAGMHELPVGSQLQGNGRSSLEIQRMFDGYPMNERNYVESYFVVIL